MNKSIWIGMTFLTGISLGIIIPWSLQKNPKFGIIDTSFIVAEQAKILAKQHPNTTFSPQRIRQITDELKEQVSQWCAHQDIILLSKGAVWGGDLKDYTQEVYADLPLQVRGE
ncbi:MAG: hypothetical protein K0M45_08730 [Candidatus Paracaedibacteraceae bacterium]|nr:hypothetical protein [Candidatus Paracaedibacteraceae bacterium]